jgi:glycosyltransferase involved in cell wall biosynthesis
MPRVSTKPLVSVIVRTMGRPELPRAVASVELQTYRPIEIVFVDAGAKGVRLPAATRVPVLTIAPEKRLYRSPAANVAMEAARGEWLAFLDEDDAWEPTHIEDLVEAAEASGAEVAYSQTKLLDNDSRFLRLLGGPYRRDMLLQSNYLSINAVIFSKRFVDMGHRYDLSYEIFEDWDFWIQLAQHGDFAYTGRSTALYYPAAGQSGGGGAGENIDRALALQQRDKLLAKWRQSAE